MKPGVNFMAASGLPNQPPPPLLSASETTILSIPSERHSLGVRRTPEDVAQKSANRPSAPTSSLTLALNGSPSASADLYGSMRLRQLSRQNAKRASGGRPPVLTKSWRQDEPIGMGHTERC
jgi:hypothetical protein